MSGPGQDVGSVARSTHNIVAAARRYVTLYQQTVCFRYIVMNCLAAVTAIGVALLIWQQWSEASGK